MRRDYSQFFDDGTIVFEAPSKAYPDGKDYQVEMDAERGLWLSGLVETATLDAAGITVPEASLAELKLGNDDEQIKFQKRVLGDTFDEMMADGVSWPLIRRIVADIFVVFTQDETAANRIIEESLAARGEAQAPANRASRRAVKKASPTASSPARTGRKTGGSNSNRASGATKAPAKAPASGRSSTSTRSATPRAATG